MTELREVGNITAGTSKAASVEYFTTALSQVPLNVTPQQDPTSFRVHISIVTSSVVEYTIDNGTTWNQLNSGTALIANAGYAFFIPINDGDLFNIRNVTTSIVNVCKVVDVAENT